MPFLQSPELGPPTPSPAGECFPPLRFRSVRTHSLAGEGVGGGPNSDESTDTVLLRYICTLWGYVQKYKIINYNAFMFHNIQYMSASYRRAVNNIRNNMQNHCSLFIVHC
jgi:hypothetical protein